MATATAEVVKYLRRKSSSGFEPITYLGTEQRFVGALRNSGINNLEEQYIIGTDTYTVKYTDDNGNQVTETSYHINDVTHSMTDYYKLISTVYKTSTADENFFFEGTVLTLPSDNTEVMYGDGSDNFPDTSAVYGVNDSTFVEEKERWTIYPSSYVILQKDELHYISGNGAVDTLVLTKTTEQEVNSAAGKEITRESIVNHLI